MIEVLFMIIVGISLFNVCLVLLVIDGIQDRRITKWYNEHKIKIGSEEYYKWCFDHKVDPRKYLPFLN